MIETTAAPTAVQSRLAFISLLLSAAVSVAAYGFLHARNNTHASFLYILLVHALVLPFFLIYWRANRSPNQAPLRLPRYQTFAAAAFVLLAVAGMITRHAHFISDEYAYGFQARIFADGRLKALPMPGAQQDPSQTPVQIDFSQTIQTPQGWFSKYPPLWPSILAAGYVLHCPWLVNPVFGALQLLLIWHLAQPWGRNTQMLAMLMAATSPYLLSLDFGLLSHAFDAVFSLLALAAVLKGVREKKLRWIAVCLLMFVASTEIRPYTGAVLGLLCAGIVGWEFRSSPKLLTRALLIFAAGAALALTLFLLVNKVFTGDPFLSPYALANGGRKIQELTFNPLKILGNLLHTWRWTITDTIRVAFPFTFPLVIYACLKENVRRNELLYLSLLFPLLILAYLLNSMGSSGNIAGERFYFEGFCAILIVGARGFDLLLSNWGVSRSSALTGLSILAAMQIAMIAFTAEDVAAAMRPYGAAYQLAHRSPPVPLVFLEDHTPLLTSKHVNWNAADWPHAPTVFLSDPGPYLRDEVACQFGRPRYELIQYDSLNDSLVASDGSAECPARGVSLR